MKDLQLNLFHYKQNTKQDQIYQLPYSRWFYIGITFTVVGTLMGLTTLGFHLRSYQRRVQEQEQEARQVRPLTSRAEPRDRGTYESFPNPDQDNCCLKLRDFFRRPVGPINVTNQNYG